MRWREIYETINSAANANTRMQKQRRAREEMDAARGKRMDALRNYNSAISSADAAEARAKSRLRNPPQK